MKYIDPDYFPWLVFAIFSYFEIYALLVFFTVSDCKSCQFQLFLFNGIWVSLGLGSLLTHLLLRWLRDDIKNKMEEAAKGDLEIWENEKRFPELRTENNRLNSHLDWVLGFLERLIFTVFVIFSPKGAITAMGGWLALKLATSWHKRAEENRPNLQLLIRSLSLSALLCGAISLSFAFLGGILIKYSLYLFVNKCSEGFWKCLLSIN